jgi:hypothetical protein
MSNGPKPTPAPSQPAPTPAVPATPTTVERGKPSSPGRTKK